MSTLELKLSLIEQLTQIYDELLLHKIKNLISPDLIERHAIWDCRQDDWKLKDMFP